MRGNDLGGCGLKLGQGGQEAATNDALKPMRAQVTKNLKAFNVKAA